MMSVYDSLYVPLETWLETGNLDILPRDNAPVIVVSL